MKLEDKIYVAGHNGLVGSALMRVLKEKGYENIITRRSFELDLRRQKDVEEFFAQEKPDHVIIAAAKVGGIVANSTYVAEFIYDNLMIATNLIHSSYKFGVKKLLNLGSSCIYPKLAPQPLKEEYLLCDYLEPTNEPYAIAKIAAIKMCSNYNKQYGTNFISAMPTNMYGLEDNFDLDNSHVLPALVRKFHVARLLKNNDIEGLRDNVKRCARNYDPSISDDEIIKYFNSRGVNGDSVTLWGSGSPYREFLYSDDLARACLYLMENKEADEVGDFINVGYGKDISIKELAELVCEIVGFEGDIKWDTNKPDGTPKKLMDSSRINDLGWKPDVNLKDGIRNVYEKMR